MVKARSYYDREKIESMAKAMQKKTIWHSLILSIILLIMGVINIVSFFLDDYNWFSLIVGIAATAFSVYPIVAGIKTNKNSVKKAVEDMGVQNGPVEIIYEFKEKRAEKAFLAAQEEKRKAAREAANNKYKKKRK